MAANKAANLVAKHDVSILCAVIRLPERRRFPISLDINPTFQQAFSAWTSPQNVMQLYVFAHCW